MKENINCLIGLTAMAAAFSPLSCVPDAKKDTSPTKPNIVFIMADDMGYGDLGCYGQKLIKTPNIDKLAKEGVMFTQHYAGNTVCAPSRCSLMTGLHMGNAEVRGNKQDDIAGSGQWPLSDSLLTVASILQDVGYKTGMIGKWGLGNAGTSGDPLKKGFDFYYGYLDQVLAHNYYPEYLLRNGEKEFLGNHVNYLDSSEWHKGLGSYSTEKKEYSHDLFTKEALAFIDKNKDNPFFLYLPYTIPHDNGEALPGEGQEVPSFGIYENEKWSNEAKGYAAMITRMDKDIGLLIEKLRESGIDENTIVIFTSDNGPVPEVTHKFIAQFNSSGVFRGGKRDLYEGGIRVPFIARWPGKIMPNTTSDHIGAFWDFLPTACNIAGAKIPEGTNGISYLPILLGEKQPKHDYLYWEFPEKGYSVAIRMGGWKAVKNNLQENPDAPFELYDLISDPGEKHDISMQHPDIIEKMKVIASSARTLNNNFPMPGE